MKTCYIDEAGNPGMLPSRTSNVEPVFIVTGLVIDQTHIPAITTDFLSLKQRYFPGLGPKGMRRWLNWMLVEIKGGEVRKDGAAVSRRKYRQAHGFLGKALSLMEAHDARFISRIWVKGIGKPFNGRAVYSFSVQAICEGFQRLLVSADSDGLVIADHRTPAKNKYVSHSIFTQKFASAGDSYDRIVEVPTFGDSHNHAGLQMADLLCSALLAPLAIHTYCTGYVDSLHVRPGYGRWKSRYAQRLKKLALRHHVAGRWRGGITVHDAIKKRPATAMLR